LSKKLIPAVFLRSSQKKKNKNALFRPVFVPSDPSPSTIPKGGKSYQNAAPADPHSAVGVEVSPGHAAIAAQPFFLLESVRHPCVRTPFARAMLLVNNK
jgi:hypothetical protein